MKRLFYTLLIAGISICSFAQQKTSGVKTIGSMTIKVELDQPTSTVKMTMTGPSTKWLTVGFNATTMSTNVPIDCLTYTTLVLDQHLTGGHNHAVTDATGNFTLVSDTVSGTTRTVVVTRPFNTGDVNDYNFNFALNSLNIIWGVGPSTNFNSEHVTKGASVLNFTTVLGVAEMTMENDLKVFPNPSTGIFTLENDRLLPIKTIRIFNEEAKMIKEIPAEGNEATVAIDLSSLATGTYFMEIANESDRAVKKILIK